MTMILQCHGVPGSGKSQIIRKLAEEFPFEKDSRRLYVHVKWHIQCQDSGHNLKEQLELLAKKLLEHSLLSDEKHQNIADSLEELESKDLVDAFQHANVPVLILVEDPPDEQIALLKNLCANIRQNTELQRKYKDSQKIHLYISSRKNNVLLKGDHSLQCYKSNRVEGFAEHEALNHLILRDSENDNEDRLAIFRFFSGLPQGLNAAKAFCEKVRINYSQYLDLVEDVKYDIITKEEQIMQEEYASLMQHVFRAIVIPFKPKEMGNQTDKVLAWKILCCLSYLHYDRIPRYVLEQCCHVLRNKKIEKPALKNKVEVAELTSKLVDHSMCTETKENEITFHEVILNAFRLSRLSVFENKFVPLKSSIRILCTLVSKDMRKKEHSTKMFKLRRHLQTLLDHIENNQQIFKDQRDEQLLRALTSYLHETTAAIMLSESPLSFWKESAKHFEKALRVIFPSDDVIKYIEIPKNKQTAKDLAENILEISKQKGSNLPPDFAVTYASNLQLSFEELPEELDFLRTNSQNGQIFAEFEELLSEKELPEILIKKLQQCGLFLSEEQYRPIFYAERFAFILHSWSRLVLYGDQEDVKKIRKKSLWMSELCKEITTQCREQYEISLLAEPLSITGGYIPIVLRAKESDEKLKKALSLCEEKIQNQENTKVFENGMLKEVYGPSANDTKIILLRNIVRIHARLHERSSSDINITADERCKELFALSVAHSETINKCSMCFIFCAKYYASKRKLNETLKCFEKFFVLDSNSESKFHVRCWAVYNYARAVNVFDNCPSKYLVDALDKCNKVLEKKNFDNREVRKNLREQLISCRNVLKKKMKKFETEC